MTLVWYDIEKDLIFQSWELDCCFFFLVGKVKWDKFELLGEL